MEKGKNKSQFTIELEQEFEKDKRQLINTIGLAIAKFEAKHNHMVRRIHFEKGRKKSEFCGNKIDIIF